MQDISLLILILTFFLPPIFLLKQGASTSEIPRLLFKLLPKIQVLQSW